MADRSNRGSEEKPEKQVSSGSRRRGYAIESTNDAAKDRTTPTRDEPTDFSHGESKGVAGPMSGSEQVALSRDPSVRQVARTVRGEQKPICPDCGQYVGHTKSGGKPLPDTDAETFGWSCEDCNLTLPSHCHGPDAPTFIDILPALKGEDSRALGY